MFGGRDKMNDSAYLSFELLRHDRRLRLETGLKIGHELLKLILFCVSVVLTQLKGEKTHKFASWVLGYFKRHLVLRPGSPYTTLQSMIKL